MSRARVSTTIDAERLHRARVLSGLPDSRLLDRALEAYVELLERERERAALDLHPYEADPDIAWETPLAPLPYDGAIPAEVIELAQRRRRDAGR
jgi:hypothetical protein